MAREKIRYLATRTFLPRAMWFKRVNRVCFLIVCAYCSGWPKTDFVWGKLILGLCNVILTKRPDRRSGKNTTN
jgi:hypothetical protein